MSIPAAIEAVSSYLKIEWLKLRLDQQQLKNAGSFEEAVTEVAKSTDNSKPVLLFFYSKKRETKKGKDQPTKIAEKSTDFSEEFGDPKFKVQLAIKFFNCYEIDVTDISKNDSPYLCHEEAPIAVIYYQDKIYKTFTKGSSNRIYGILSTFLKKQKFAIQDFSREMAKPITTMYKSERKIYSENSKIKQFKKARTTKARIIKMQKELQEYIKVSNQAKNEMDKIIAKYANQKT